MDPKRSKVVLNGGDTKRKSPSSPPGTPRPIAKILTVNIGQVTIEFSVFVPYSTEPIEVTVLGAEN